MDLETKGETLSFEVIERVLNELKELGTKEIYMAGGGEPTMHPKIFAIWKLIKDLGMTLYVNTNFVQLSNKEMICRIIDTGVDHFTVSVWAGSSEVYLATHPNRRAEDFFAIRDSLTLLNSLKKSKPYIKIYNVISRYNYQDFHRMLEFCLQTNCESVEFTLVDTIPGKTDILLLQEEERRWLYEQCEEVMLRVGNDLLYEGRLLLFGFERFMRRLSSTYSCVGEHDKNIVESFPCYIGHLFARIMPDGNVNSCLKAHRVPVGNIYEQTFSSIWSGTRQKLFRRKSSVCQKTDLFFSLIGNNADVECGCYKSCDDIARNLYMHKRLMELNVFEKGFLSAYQSWLKLTGQELS